MGSEYETTGDERSRIHTVNPLNVLIVNGS